MIETKSAVIIMIMEILKVMEKEAMLAAIDLHPKDIILSVIEVPVIIN